MPLSLLPQTVYKYAIILLESKCCSTMWALTFYRPCFFITACPVSPDSHKRGANIWKDFVLCYVRKQARKRMYAIVSYPENIVMSNTSLADHKVRCGGDFLLRICKHTGYCLCERTYMLCAYLH